MLASSSIRLRLAVFGSLFLLSTAILACSHSRTELQREWDSLLARVDGNRPEWEKEIRFAVRSEFERRLPKESSWREELERSEGRLLQDLLDEHLASPFTATDPQRHDGVWRSSIEQCLYGRVDFFVEGVNAPERLAGSEPGVRMLDLTIRLRVVRRGLGTERQVEICCAGAWLDEAIAQHIASSLPAEDDVIVVH